MKIYDMAQGSRQWINIRLGIPTASNFHRIVKEDGKPRVGQMPKTYAYELLGEWLTGEPCDSGKSQYMERGSAYEAQGIKTYEFTHEVKTQKVGFVLHDSGRFGCSPDLLVGDDGGLDIKTPGIVQHVCNLLSGPTDHNIQMQGCMWICERRWWDVLSYHPSLQSAELRIERDDELIENMEESLNLFCADLDRMREKLLEKGLKPAVLKQPEKTVDKTICPVGGVAKSFCRCPSCEDARVIRKVAGFAGVEVVENKT